MSQWFNDISVQDLQTGIVNMPDYWDAIASKNYLIEFLPCAEFKIGSCWGKTVDHYPGKDA